MADSADRAELILQVTDAISGPANKIATSLDKLNVQLGGTDKAVIKAEKSFGSAIAAINDLSKSSNTAAASSTKLGQATSKAAQGASAEWKAASASAAAYAAQLREMNALSLRTGANGVVRTSTGQFGPSVATQTATVEAYIEATQRATAALAREEAVYTQLAAATGISNRELKENLSLQQAQSALATRNTATLIPGNPTLKPTQTIGPTLTGASAAQLRAVQAAALGVASAENEGIQASSRFSAAMQALAGASNSTRYALFSVAQSATRIGVELLALPVLSAIVSASFDRDFANVARATATASGGSEVNLKSLRKTLVDLSEQIPVSFKDLTDIATQGAQLGVSGTKGLASFTKTVSELSATTNLTADAAGTMLGRFLAVNAIKTNQFDRLASSVLNVGVNSAATESQIAGIATQIVGIGKIAGFTAPQIVGLSGAIASVSSNGAALARGAITRFITVLQAGVESGGPALQAFAKTAHLTATQVQEDWGTNKFAADFQKFFRGLSEEGGNANQVLIEMGITSVRDIPLFLNLANGWKTLNTAMKDSQQGWNDTNIIAIHYEKINDTLVSKVKELGNTFMASLDQMGKMSNSGLAPLVDGLTGLLKVVTDIVSSPIGGWFASFALGGMIVFGALSLFLGSVARIAAGIQAMRVALTEGKAALNAYNTAVITSSATTAEFGVVGRVAAGAMGAVGISSRAAAVGVTILGDAIKAATLVGLLFVALDLAKPVGEWASSMVRDASGLTNSTKQVKAAAQEGVKAINQLNEFSKAGNANGQGALAGWQSLFYKAGTGLAGFASQLKELDDSWVKIDFGGAGNKAKQLDSAFAGLVNSGNAKKAADEFSVLAKSYVEQGGKISTLMAWFPKYNKALEDAASKADTFSNSVDRNNKTLTELNTSFQTFSGMDAKTFDKYSQAIVKSIDPLTSFNSVIGQVQTALQAQAQAQADAAGGSAKASDYYDGTSVSLQQMTDQYNANTAVANTWLANIQQVASTYGNDIASQFIQAGYSVTNASILQQLINATPDQAQAYIAAMTGAANAAATAMGVALITAGGLVTSTGAAIGQDTATQMGQMLQAGFSPADIMQAFNLQFASNPANPQVDTSPAQRALNDFINRNMGFDINGQANMSVRQGQAEIDNFISANNGRHIAIYVDSYQGTYQGYTSSVGGLRVPLGSTGGYFTGSRFMYDTGGYTGNGGKYDPAGIVHRGEFVFNKEATNAYGVAYLMNMMRSYRGAQGRGYSGGGPVGTYTQPGTMEVSLSAIDRQLLAANGNVRLFLDGKELTANQNGNNIVASNRREN